MPPSPDRAKGGLARRILSALILIPPVLAAVHFGSPFFDILILLGGAVLAWEWVGICGRRPGWLLLGAAYVLAPVAALIWLRLDPEVGRATVYWLLVLIWAADTGGYVFGRLLGGPKLAPRISPNKTWAGLLGAVVFAGVAGTGTGLLLGRDSLLPITAASGILGAVGQGGDLAESWFKRRFGVKDSSNLIPGHGGLMDRADALVLASVVVAVVSLAAGEGMLAWL